MNIWRTLQNPFVLSLHGWCTIDDEVYLVSPWMENGNIMAFLENNPTHDRLKAITDIAHAMKYLHEQDPPIVHADIRGVCPDGE